jgi:phage gpG-like protein
MITITLKDGVSPVLRKLQHLQVDATPVMRAMGGALLSITQGNFYRHGAQYRPVPWPNKADGTPSSLKKSGRLSTSMRLKVGPHSATVSTDAPYAAIHQFGGKTKPHVIRPKFGKALAFTAKKFGKIVVKSVNHPGSNIPARPFFPISGDRLTPAAEGLVIRAGYRALQRIIGSTPLA